MTKKEVLEFSEKLPSHTLTSAIRAYQYGQVTWGKAMEKAAVLLAKELHRLKKEAP